MAWQRKIPFGYMIRDGLIQPHSQEADAVQYIFRQYLAGGSLLTIAEDMIRQGVRYHQHTAEWNKNMVKGMFSVIPAFFSRFLCSRPRQSGL